MKVLQVVGYKNSGKTTWTTQFISWLTARDVQVAALKHHGHGGVPIGLTETDSERHREAGAIIAGVVGEHLFQLSSNARWEMEKLLAFYDMFGTEVLVMEGYKQYDYEKVVLIRDATDVTLLAELSNVKAVITQVDLRMTCEGFPIFMHDEVAQIKDWLFLHVENAAH